MARTNNTPSKPNAKTELAAALAQLEATRAELAAATAPKLRGVPTVAVWRAKGAACKLGNGKCAHVWQYAHAAVEAGTVPSVAEYQLANPTANLCNTAQELSAWARCNEYALPRRARTEPAKVEVAAASK